MAEGHKLVMWTVREGRLLDEAVEWCRERGVEFSAINETLRASGEHNNNTRKIDADIYIDDCNIGGPYDWESVYYMIHNNVSYHTLLRETKKKALAEEQQKPKKKKRWGWF